MANCKNLAKMAKKNLSIISEKNAETEREKTILDRDQKQCVIGQCNRFLLEFERKSVRLKWNQWWCMYGVNGSL